MAVAELAAAWKQVVPSLLTVREIRDLLGCSRSTVYRWIDRGLVERVGSIHAPEDYNFQKVVLLAITHEELKARIREAVREQGERGEQPLFLSQRLAVAVLANLPEVALQDDGDEETPQAVLLEEFSKLLTKLCEESAARNSLIADFEEAAKSIFRNRELEAETAELEDMMRSLRDVQEHEAELEELGAPSDFVDLDTDDEVMATSLTVEEDEADAALLATVPFDDTEDTDLNREGRFADLESEFEAPVETNPQAEDSEADLELGAFPEDDLVARLLDGPDADLPPEDMGERVCPEELAVDLLELDDDESDIDVDSALDAIWQYENSKHAGSQGDEPEDTGLEVVDVESSLERDGTDAETETETEATTASETEGTQPDEIELGEVFLDLEDTDFELSDEAEFAPEPV
ncbi:MAG: helix-turn-helix domain-containing protein, partial [Planctomycetes bacterium]|nr:helix-turn-helix domain-containing protein [Planctomycetota bacterium]